MPHAQLERLFVAREGTLDAIMARIRTAAESTSRNHTLLVGPRGSGKTHLVALAYHRTNALRADGLQVQVSWLPEDAWTIASYRHLLKSIVDRLEPATDSPPPSDTDELETLIASRAASGGPIVVFVENLDQILTAIGNHGQQQLRHMLQTTRPLLLVATSTRLARNLSDQNAPFYGFFTTTRLEPLTVEQAAAMLTRIAEERNEDTLADYLETPEGLARLRAITHLAGGQPRMWALLATALTVTGLGELVELLLTRFDDLTPYYQEQLARLSPQQRLIVAELAEADRPLNVSTLAERLGVEQRSLAKTIVDLADRGWVEPTASQAASLLDKRRTYYELAEPLARISFQLKEARGKPLRVVVDFLKHWFDPDELDAEAGEAPLVEYVAMATSDHHSDSVVAVTRRLNRLPLTRCSAVDLLAEIDDALAALDNDDPDGFLGLHTPVRTALEQRIASPDDDITTVRLEIHRAAQDEFGEVPHASMPAWITRAESLVESSSRSKTTEAQRVLAAWHQKAWRFTEAEAVLAAVSESLGPDDPDTLVSRNNLAYAYESAGDLRHAIPLYEQTLADSERVLGPDHPNTLTSRNSLASAYHSAGDLRRAIRLFEQTLADRERVHGTHHPSTLASRNNLASAYRSAGNLRRAIALYEQTLVDSERVLGTDHPNRLASRNNLAYAYESAGDLGRAIPLFEETLIDRERILGPDHRDTLTSRNNLASVYQSSGDLPRAIPLFEQTLTDRERILGPNHPDTLTSRNNLASAYQSSGDLPRAIPLFEQTLADSERVLGTDHPDTLTSRNNLAYAYESAGDLGRAIPLLEQTLADLERVLGPDHPNTRTYREYFAEARKAAGRHADAT